MSSIWINYEDNKDNKFVIAHVTDNLDVLEASVNDVELKVKTFEELCNHIGISVEDKELWTTINNIKLSDYILNTTLDTKHVEQENNMYTKEGYKVESEDIKSDSQEKETVTKHSEIDENEEISEEQEIKSYENEQITEGKEIKIHTEHHGGYSDTELPPIPVKPIELGNRTIEEIGKQLSTGISNIIKQEVINVKVESAKVENVDTHVEAEHTEISSIDNIEYTEEDFIKEVFNGERTLKAYKKALYKKNIILEGCPGTGKTFKAKKFAQTLVGFKESDRILHIVMSSDIDYGTLVVYKELDGSIHKGLLTEFFDKAKEGQAKNANKKYVLIMEEIGRGNIQDALGPYFNLMESSYRDTELDVSGIGKVCIPSNVIIIMTTNRDSSDSTSNRVSDAFNRRCARVTEFSILYDNRYVETLMEFLVSKGLINDENRVIYNTIIENVISSNKKMKEANVSDDGLVGHDFIFSKDIINEVEYSVLPNLRDKRDRIRNINITNEIQRLEELVN